MENINFDNYKTIIIKVGTNIIIKNGELNKEFLTTLVHEVSELRKKEKNIIIVTSGAIGLGKKKLNYTPVSVPDQQGLAAVGQLQLMNEYQKRFENVGIECAQILLSQNDLNHKLAFENIKNAFDFLFKHKVIGIVNENDVVATEELRKNGNFSDNDALASHLAEKLQANLLVLLTEKGGLIGKDNKLLEEFTSIDELAVLENTKGGRGGIDTKIKAIQNARDNGITVLISGSNNLRGFSGGKITGTIAKPKA